MENENKANSMQYIGIPGVWNRFYQEEVKGMLPALAVNSSEKGIEGIAIAGLINHSEGNMKGIAIAGIANTSDDGDLTGIAAAGVFNYFGGNFEGVAVAPVNYTKSSFGGLQIGLVNIAKEVHSPTLQIGIVNRCGNHVSPGINFGGMEEIYQKVKNKFFAYSFTHGRGQ